jgi:hypothetical protein
MLDSQVATAQPDALATGARPNVAETTSGVAANKVFFHRLGQIDIVPPEKDLN